MPVEYSSKPSIDGTCHLLHAVCGCHGVEVDAGYAVCDELVALGGAPLDAYLAHLVVALAAQHLGGQGLRDVYLEGLGDDAQLAGGLQGLDAGDDGDGDALGTGTLDETEVAVVVVEELGDGILGTGLDLLAQPVEVHIHVGRLLVLLGVAGHAVGEGLAGLLDGRAVDEVALVEAVDLCLQLYGVAVAVAGGGEQGLVLGLVATQQQQVGDAEELEVEQHILGLLTGEPAAEDMGHNGDVVPVLDGGSHSHGAGAAAQRYLVEDTLGRFLVYVFASVGGDIDVAGGELAQLVDGAEQAVDACALERGQHFEGEGGAVACGDGVYDAHCLVYG